MPFSTRVFESTVIRSGRVTPASSPAAAGPAIPIAASSQSAGAPALKANLRDDDLPSGGMSPMLTRPDCPAAGGPGRSPSRSPGQAPGPLTSRIGSGKIHPHPQERDDGFVVTDVRGPRGHDAETHGGRPGGPGAA